MNFVEMEENEILRIIEPMMDNCLRGSNEDNYAKHTRDFTERMKKIVTPENLKLQLSKEPRAFLSKENLFIFLEEKILLVSYGNNSFHHQKMS
tara:strand:+ start:448 stop:726 length:279 start_codon:yes stop_codon:yes gene_type:complete